MGQHVSDYLPGTRREWVIFLVGAAVSLGLQQVPGVTLEPEHATECRTKLAGCVVLQDRCEEVAALAWCKLGACRDGVGDGHCSIEP